MILDLQFYIKDTKSSNGTFVNDRRLSRSGEESAQYELKSGDIVQFGVNVEGPSRGEDTCGVLFIIHILLLLLILIYSLPVIMALGLGSKHRVKDNIIISSSLFVLLID